MITRKGTHVVRQALVVLSLLVVVLSFAALLVAYSPRLALWESPDEPERAAEAYRLAGIPVDVSGPVLPRLVAPDTPLAPTLWAAALRVIGATAMPVVRPNPDFLIVKEGGRSEEAALHGHEEEEPWSPDVRWFRALRWLSAPFGVVAVVVAFALGRALFHDLAGAATLAASVAWLPGFLFLAATLQPLAPAAALGSLALLGALRLADRPGSLVWAAIAGGSAGLAALCAPAGLAALAPVLVALVSTLVAGGCEPGAMRSSRRRVVSVSVAVAGWLVLGGWWYAAHASGGARGILTQGGDAALARALNAEASRVAPPQIGSHPLVQTFVGRFGWDTTRAPDWVYVATSLAVLLAVVGWLAGAAIAASGTERPERRDVASWLVVVAAAMASLLLVVAAATSWPDAVPVDGRGMLVVAPAWPALVIGGLRLLAGRRARWSAALLPCALVAASVASLPGFSRPRYRVDPVWESPPASVMTASGTATFAGAATLYGYRVASAAVARGRPLDVSLYWGRSTPRPVAFQSFVHLARADGRPIAQKDQQPGAGWYPSDLWQSRDVVEDTHRVDVPADVAPGRYVLIVGTYDLGTGTRFKVRDSSWAALGDSVVIGDVVVGP